MPPRREGKILLEGKLIRKTTLEALMLVALSVAVLIFGAFLSSDEESKRVQRNYAERFGDVLPADRYEELPSEAFSSYEEISHVYEAFDEEGNPYGFVIDLTVTTKDYTQLHLLTGITYDGAELTGIKHIADEEFPASITDEEIDLIAGQCLFSQVPVALNGNDMAIDPEQVTSTIYGLNDGVYYAQKLYADNSGYLDFVEMEVRDGLIVSVQWDAFNVDRTTKNKREASLTGAYSVSGELWATQAYNLCHKLLLVQDPAELAMKSDGTTDIVDGVTINIRPFTELVQECIGYSMQGYTKDMYLEDLSGVITYLFGGTPEELGLTTSDGYIVYSFDDYPNLFKELDEDGNVIGDLTLAQTAMSLTGQGGDDGEGYVEGIETPVSGNIVQRDDNEGYEDGIIPDNDIKISSESVDGIPFSEIRTSIDGIPGASQRSEYVISGINISYKFLKEYLNWMA